MPISWRPDRAGGHRRSAGLRACSSAAACRRLRAFRRHRSDPLHAEQPVDDRHVVRPAGVLRPENEALGQPLAVEQVRLVPVSLIGRPWSGRHTRRGSGGVASRSRAHATLALVLALPLRPACQVRVLRGPSVPDPLWGAAVFACAAIAGIALPAACWPLAASRRGCRVVASPPESLRRRSSPSRSATPQPARATGRDRCLRALRRPTIMMSMGSLAHYMHDLSRLTSRPRLFPRRQRAVWPYAATRGPRGFVTWVAPSEERAEGGDYALYSGSGSESSRFLEGFDRVAEGGGVALYRAR